jgi:hypothetical protein
MGLHLMDMHLASVYLMGVCLMGIKSSAKAHLGLGAMIGKWGCDV